LIVWRCLWSRASLQAVLMAGSRLGDKHLVMTTSSAVDGSME
jgi:hypothetical protein